jgi:hypothetical protein
LRDDRDARFESMRPPHSRDASPRRPLSIYPSSGTGPTLFEDNYYQRPASFRAPEVPVSASFSARHDERASSESNSHHTPLVATPTAPEPVAYLTMGLDFVNGSALFWDTAGLPNMIGRNLGDVVLPAELEKVTRIQSHFNGEQKKREPNYLPPILGNGPQSIQRLGFSVEDFGRFPLNFHDQLMFKSTSGYARRMTIRAGLAKEGSFYFIVLLLHVPPRQQQSSPAPTVPGAQTALGHKRPSPETAFAPRPPFDPIRNRPSESPHVSSLAPEPARHIGGPASFIDHGSKYAARQYEAARERHPYSGRSYHTSQHEAARPNIPGLQQGLQLPPIRSQPDRTPLGASATSNRSERSSRVDIGGLIDKPDEPRRFVQERR